MDDIEKWLSSETVSPSLVFFICISYVRGFYLLTSEQHWQSVELSIFASDGTNSILTPEDNEDNYPFIPLHSMSTANH